MFNTVKVTTITFSPQVIFLCSLAKTFTSSPCNLHKGLKQNKGENKKKKESNEELKILRASA